MPSSVAGRRVGSIIAATLVSLSSGTNYAYSAWAPQFAKQMKLSSTQSNMVGVAGNLGMYAFGILVGKLVDAKGPRPNVVVGALAIGIGYFALYQAYINGPGSMGIVGLLFFSTLTGFGSCSGFSAAVKSAATNFPMHRGTATAFPLAALGLSAFFFSSIAALAFHENTAAFLLLLSLGSSLIALSSAFFVVLLPPTYISIPSERNRIRRKKSEDRNLNTEPSTPSFDPESACDASALHVDTPECGPESEQQSGPDIANPDSGETSSLMSRSITSAQSDELPPTATHHSLYTDIRGMALVKSPEFWQLVVLLGTLAGIGLMTINNIGYNARALWNHYDPSVGPGFVQKQQMVNVSMLSLFSFVGRLLSGIGSDVLVNTLHASRTWCIVTSGAVFAVTQLMMTQVNNPHYLVFVTALTGLAYGFLFGVFPSLVAHVFGIDGLSQNWGTINMAPVVSSNIFNILYGAVYDHQSVVDPNGEHNCHKGNNCYRSTYWTTFCAAIGAVVLATWTIWYEKRKILVMKGVPHHVHINY